MEHPSDSHCRQILLESIGRYVSTVEPLDITTIPQFLVKESTTMPYYHRPENERSTLHFGQLKLLICELKLLLWYTTAITGTEYSIIYAGAAPGHHIPFLASLFPHCKFELYDPAPFCRQLQTPPKNVVVHHRTFFADIHAQQYRRCASNTNHTVFISDIRTGTEEQYVGVDMQQQERWTRTIQAEVSMLKFRLPWSLGTTPYIKGCIMLPAYAPTTSTETRLVCTRMDTKASPHIYHNIWYEQACAYHNTIGRVTRYIPLCDVQIPGLDRCYDCSSLLLIVIEYLLASNVETTSTNIKEFIGRMLRSFDVNRDLNTPHTASSTHKHRRH